MTITATEHAATATTELAVGDPGAAGRPHEHGADAGDLVLEELLIEEISIDGMCGVY